MSVDAPERLVFPRVSVSRERVVDYYLRIGPEMLPWIVGRPLVVERLPEGLGGPAWWQCNLPEQAPDWVDRVVVPARDGGRTVYAVASDEAGLAWLAANGAVGIDTLLSDSAAPDRPAEVRIGVVPCGGDFATVQQVARRLRDVLASLDLAPRVAVSAAVGLDVVVDVADDVDFATTRAFAHAVAEQVAGSDAVIDPVEPTGRGSVGLDLSANAVAAHGSAPWTLVARSGAPIAAPLSWERALDPGFHPRSVTIESVFSLLDDDPAPWDIADRARVGIAEATRRLSR